MVFCPGDHQLINECDFLLDAPEPPSNCCSLIELNGATIPINANPNWSVSFGQINQREIKEEDERPIMCPREFLCDFKSFFFRRIFIGSAEFKRWYFKCVLDREIKIHSCRFSLWEILCRNGCWWGQTDTEHRNYTLAIHQLGNENITYIIREIWPFNATYVKDDGYTLGHKWSRRRGTDLTESNSQKHYN